MFQIHLLIKSNRLKLRLDACISCTHGRLLMLKYERIGMLLNFLLLFGVLVRAQCLFLAVINELILYSNNARRFRNLFVVMKDPNLSNIPVIKHCLQVRIFDLFCLFVLF